MSFIYDLTDTWNDSGTTFTGIKLNVTDTASASGSLLMDLQVGGVSRVRATKGGALIASDGSNTAPSFAFDGVTNKGFYRNAGVMVFADANADIWWTAASNLIFRSNAFFGFSSGTTAGASADTVFLRDAAGVLAQRNGVNSQEFRLYNTYTDASNYERMKFGWSSNVFEIKPENAGTGSARVVHISGLPTSNPGPGILWNNAGTPAIGT